MSNPGENSELVKRLHSRAEFEDNGGVCDRMMEDAVVLLREAADAIETAETLLEEAWRALEPFIKLADNVFSDGKNATVADEVTLWCFNDTDITFGDLRRARATHDRIGK